MTCASKRFPLCFFSMVMLASSSVADDVERITRSPAANAFYAKYEVLDNQPGCNGADQIAYRVYADLQDIGFRAHSNSNSNRSTFDFQFPNSSEPAVCSYTERRGGKVVRFTRPCSAEGASAKEDAWTTNYVQLDLEMEVISCLSPLGRTDLEGTWSATLLQSGSDQVLEGDFFANAIKAKRSFRTGGQDVLHADGTITQISYRDDFSNSEVWLGDGQKHPIANELVDATALHVQVRCLPFELETSAGDGQLRKVPIFVETPLWFFLTDRNPVVCLSADCPVWNDKRWLSFGSGGCR